MRLAETLEDGFDMLYKSCSAIGQLGIRNRYSLLGSGMPLLPHPQVDLFYAHPPVNICIGKAIGVLITLAHRTAEPLHPNRMTTGDRHFIMFPCWLSIGLFHANRHPDVIHLSILVLYRPRHRLVAQFARTVVRLREHQVADLDLFDGFQAFLGMHQRAGNEAAHFLGTLDLGLNDGFPQLVAGMGLAQLAVERLELPGGQHQSQPGGKVGIVHGQTPHGR